MVSVIIVLVNFCVVLAIGMMVAGRGLTAVSAFGTKFRALICCQRKDDKPKDDEPGAVTLGVQDVTLPKGNKSNVPKKDRKGSKAIGLIQAEAPGSNAAPQSPVGLYPHQQGSAAVHPQQNVANPQMFQYGNQPQVAQQIPMQYQGNAVGQPPPFRQQPVAQPMGQQMGQPMGQQMGRQMGQQMGQQMAQPMGPQGMAQQLEAQAVYQTVAQVAAQGAAQGVAQPALLSQQSSIYGNAQAAQQAPAQNQFAYVPKGQGN